ncbi:MAG TPA: hypothetical protein VIY73_23990 [Polyangiaceae bacterium]
MSALFIGLALGAAFLLGLRTGIAFGIRAERRRKGGPKGARA